MKPEMPKKGQIEDLTGKCNRIAKGWPIELAILTPTSQNQDLKKRGNHAESKKS